MIIRWAQRRGASNPVSYGGGATLVESAGAPTPPTFDNFILKKNLAGNQPLFLYTIFDYDGQGTDLNFCRYPSAIGYDGVTYEPFTITHESIGENAQGQIDKVSVQLGNVSRLIMGYLENLDLRDKKVRIRTVFFDLLTDDLAHLDDTFYIDDYVAGAEVVEFNLSSRFDLLDVNLPLRRYSRNYCSWIFKSTECGYAGAETTCNKTFQRCRELVNTPRFGGFPSIPYKRLIV